MHYLGPLKRIAALCLILSQIAATSAQPDFPLLSAWQAIEPYTRSEKPGWPSIEMTCANHSSDDWFVRSESGTIKVSRREVSAPQEPLPFEIPAGRTVDEGLRGRRVVQKVADGYLIGTDAGEWGGALWWFSPDGKTMKKLGEQNVHGLLSLDGKYYALTGLAHLGIDEGAIVDAAPDGAGGWVAKPVTDLGSKPNAFITDSDGSVLVLTNKAVIRFSKGLQTRTIHSLEGSLGTLYPTSLAKDSEGRLYIGMRFAVVRLSPNGEKYMEQWLVPRACRKWQPGRMSCVCID